jgi:murein tripeptide amidase MpaA
MTQDSRPPVPKEWQTHAEQTDYRETARYEDTVAYAQKLAAASTLLRYETFGRSGEGRELPLLIAAADDAFTPEAAHQAGKAVVLIQACIHAGEPDGKDAGFALLRDIAITKTQPDLLRNVVVIFIPIYNTDGHERSSPYNRINQNGPAEMGWRTTTSYQNLNRDYMKADTPETHSWLALWNRWHPDLFIDCHVTDGADYRYNITYQFEHHDGIAPSVLEWEREVMDGKVFPATEAAGNVVSWYLEFADNRDFSKGIRDFNGSPRFSTGYVPLRNRPGVLIETHMIKDYRSRVIGTYDLLRFTLAEVNRDPQKLISAGRAADEATITRGARFDPEQSYPIDFELTDQPVPYNLKALSSYTEMSDVSGETRVVFGSEPLDVTVPMYNTFRVRTAIVPPLAYIVPPQWREAIEVIKAHGLHCEQTSEATEIDVESYRFDEVTWPSSPFEGRFMPRFKAEPTTERRRFPAGSVVVPLDQNLAKVAINLLEPQAPDSLVAWGLFNAIFEQKEYGEHYVLEALAREMMEQDPALRREFEHKLTTEPGFAGSAAARLEFFYKRSPYWDQQMNLYPVGRITSRQELKLEGARASHPR